MDSLRLPDEILQEVFLWAIEDAGDATACSLATVSRCVRAVSWPIRWRSVKITMPNAAFLLALYLEQNPGLCFPVQNLLLWSYGAVHPSLWSRPAPSASSWVSRALRTRPARFQDGRAAMEWAATRIMSALAPTLRFLGWVLEDVPTYALLPVNLPHVEEITLAMSSLRTMAPVSRPWSRPGRDPLRVEAYPTLRRLRIAAGKRDHEISKTARSILCNLDSLAPGLTHLRISSCTVDDIRRALEVCAGYNRLHRVTFQPSPDAWACYPFGSPTLYSNCINALPENIIWYLRATGGPLHRKVALTDWVGGPVPLHTRYARQYLGQVSGVVAEDFDRRRAGADLSWDEGQVLESAELEELLAQNAGVTFDMTASVGV
jgi:hypothetical protein